jgi:hypothetical protein
VQGVHRQAAYSMSLFTIVRFGVPQTNPHFITNTLLRTIAIRTSLTASG